jgi:hypothetical protein
MQIGLHQVATPKDHPWAYSPTWRHEIAKLTVDADKVTYPGGHDPFIQQQIRFLRHIRPNVGRQTQLSGDRQSTSEWLPFQRAFTLYEGHDVSSARVEAMLLCPELSLAQIASKLGPTVDPADIKTYERLYFNIRDENGMVLESPWLREYFAGGNQVQHNPTDYRTHWKLLAFEGGQRSLFAVWNWPLPDSEDLATLQTDVMTNNVFQDLERRSRFGTLGNRDLVELFGNLRPAAAIGLREGDRQNARSSRSTLLEILNSIRPKPLEVTTQALLGKQEELEQKIEVVRRLTTGAATGSVVEQTQIMISNGASRRQQDDAPVDVQAEPISVPVIGNT